MQKKKWISSLTFSLAYASILSLGLVCFLNLMGAVLVAAFFGESLLREYPRFMPFCALVGFFALMALLAVFYFNLKISKKIVYTKLTWFLQTACAVVLSFPFLFLWNMLFDFLQNTF